MNQFYFHTYLNYDNVDFFTAVFLPEADKKFPTVIMRSPYVSNFENMSDQEALNYYLPHFNGWLNAGYAVVMQHCRGTGKSSGAFVPYIYEREDGLFLRSWIRKQNFYNGEIFLCGGSYTASLHYSTAPFKEDIKGAVFEVQDNCRYRLWYRNGVMRKGHANWHFGLYKQKCGLNKTFNFSSFAQLPLAGLSGRDLGDYAEDFEKMLAAQKEDDDFWNTRLGGAEARDTTINTPIPILFTTGYNDFYVGGMFKMWNSMSDSAKARCAMLVSPYNHGDGFDMQNGIEFENGRRSQQFGGYTIDWFENIRNGKPLPYKKGKIAYYRTFENTWQEDFYDKQT